MKKIIFILLVINLTFSALGQTKTHSLDFNFGFEKTTINQKLPDDWIEYGQGYDITVDSVIKHSGKNSLLIQSLENRANESFVAAMYTIPAIYKGNEIELRAFMKLKDVKDGQIGLMLRIDGKSAPLKFDNMMDKNINGTSDWQIYSVKLSYPDMAKEIVIGAILHGKGQLWVDDFELLIDGNDIR